MILRVEHLKRPFGMTKRFQFSLRALLVTVLIAPPALYWFVRSRQALQAAHEFTRASAFLDMGITTFQDVYDCSCRLRDAELAIPFSNRRTILIAYLNRVAHLERHEDALLHFATLGDGMIEELKVRIATLKAERESLERALGVKAIDRP
jgi:hypothetical protein